MFSWTEINNLDLFSVGIAVAGTGVLGFAAFFNDRKNASNRAFLAFSVATILWGVVNYLSYQVWMVWVEFWLIKATVFFGVWQSFTLFRFLYVFPGSSFSFPKFYKMFLVPVVFITAILTLTPLVFRRVVEVDAAGRILSIENGPGIAIFGTVVLGLIVCGIFLLIQKAFTAKAEDRAQLFSVLSGIILTFLLLMVFNFILPAFFDTPRFIPLGAIFIFPFILATFYAMVRHRFLNIKIVATEILTFLLATFSFFEILLSRSAADSVFRSGIFVMLLIFGILLIRSVRREVKQREKLQKLTEELQAANEKLKELDRIKSEFLSFASHQVKSPLAVIKGCAELILDGSYGKIPQQVAETVFKIKSSSDQMIALVNNLLDLRKIEEGRMEYAPEEVEVSKFVSDVVEGLRPLADARKLALSFVSSAEGLRAKIDKQKFYQVIQNFVDNSIKYTQSGFVKVEVAPISDKKSVRISISDSGRGMSQELIANLFKQFNRDPGVRKIIQGTGLGLYIAKQIVIAHGGEVWAESEGEGKGSTFSVSIPTLG